MDILVIDQCSSSKSYPSGCEIFDSAEIDEASLEALRDRDEVISVPARDLYEGRQQRHISDAVDSLRTNGHSVDRYFISAGFGLVEEGESLPPYDVTFAEMTPDDIDSRATALGISDDTRDLLSENEYDVVFFALGSDYYRTLEFSEIISRVPETTTVVIFNQEEDADRYDNVVSIPARTEDAKELGEIVIALKGSYLKNFAGRIATGVTLESAADVVAACVETTTLQKDLDEY